MSDYQRRHELERYLYAVEVVERSTLSVEDARRELDELQAVDDWLFAERRHLDKIQRWLAAERKWKLQRLRFDDETYAAGKRGWEAIKRYVPNLDGVSSFEELPESAQFRNAAFAAAVLGLLSPPEVKSQKQIDNN